MSEGFDPQALLAQALEMQQRLLDAQAEAAESTVEGTAGGGKVRVTMTGTGDVVSVRIDPAVVDPDDVELLEDLVLAAFRDASTKVGLLAEQRLGSGLLGGMGDLFGGVGGGFGGGVGGAGLLGGALDATSSLAPGNDKARATDKAPKDKARDVDQEDQG
jgi:DNA-binding YbaB/EbfC family protein